MKDFNSQAQQQNLLQDLIALLGQDERLVVEGQLLKNKVIELALALDGGLLRLLLADAGIKRHFFQDVDGVLVFDKIKFQHFVGNKAFLPDSYTAFKNKIGLTAQGAYLTDSKEVVLAWPYKDCILEGGQTKEDAKRDEVFWNETLAPDQIDRLLAPKALTRFKKYDQDGAHEVTRISRDDNLIVKGNNLLALHTLKQAYTGKVKLIYIDPPYNTGSDGFGYNDRFNHSSWLTFMRNRLEAARRLLSQDGSIWINIDDNEAHYLKVLCDEVFGRDNFVATIVWQKFHSVKSNAEYNISRSHDNILVYVKKPNLLTFSKLSMSEDALKVYKNPDNDPRGKWRTAPLTVSLLGGARGASFAKTGKSNGLYEIIAPNGKRHKPSAGRCWFSEAKVEELKKDNRIWWGKDGNATPMEKIFLNEKGGLKTISTFWNHTDFGSNKKANEEMKLLFPNNLGGDLNFSTPKPEMLINSIIDVSTKEGDIVLDFFVGSGTTAAVAHKMNRRYIGIEQMDYIDDITVSRLKKVMAGEQGGISKSVNWQGGGSFIYCELAQANQIFVDQIQEATNSEELTAIWRTMQDTAFLSYRIDPKQLDLAGLGFMALSLADQKRFLIEVLDKNLLYVPASEIDDVTYGVSDEDKKLNRQFFGE